MTVRAPQTRGRRRRRDQPRAIHTFIVGGLLLVAGGIVLITMLRLYSGVPTVNYGQVYVSTPTIGNLLAHDFVRIGGKRVGQVLAIDVGEDGRPRVELQLSPGTQLPRDTKVRIRANGLLGARYVELAPGRSRDLLERGATIEGDDSAYTFGLPEAINTFDRKTRRGLQTSVAELGQGLAGNGRGLNDTVRLSAWRSGQFDRLMREVLDRRGAAARLAPSLASAFAALDRSTDTVRRFPDATSDAFQQFVAERAATQATLDRAPAALSAVQDGLGRGEKLVTAVRDLSTVASEQVLPQAPAAFRDLAVLLRDSRAPLRRSVPVLRRVGGLGLSLRRFILAVEKLVPDARVTLDNLRPVLKVVGDHKCDVVDSAVTLRSMTGWGQPGTGPNGSPMAFRLQVFVPNGLEVAGITDTTGLLKRDGLEPPCKYPQREYAQLLPSIRRPR